MFSVLARKFGGHFTCKSTRFQNWNFAQRFCLLSPERTTPLHHPSLRHNDQRFHLIEQLPKKLCWEKFFGSFKGFNWLENFLKVVSEVSVLGTNFVEIIFESNFKRSVLKTLLKNIWNNFKRSQC